MRDLKTKTQNILGLDSNSSRDIDDLEIEDFNMTHNLMYSDIVIAKSFEECLRYINGK